MMKRGDYRPGTPDSRDCYGLRPRNEAKDEISMATSVAIKQSGEVSTGCDSIMTIEGLARSSALTALQLLVFKGVINNGSG